MDIINNPNPLTKPWARAEVLESYCTRVGLDYGVAKSRLETLHKPHHTLALHGMVARFLEEHLLPLADDKGVAGMVKAAVVAHTAWSEGKNVSTQTLRLLVQQAIDIKGGSFGAPAREHLGAVAAAVHHGFEENYFPEMAGQTATAYREKAHIEKRDEYVALNAYGKAMLDNLMQAVAYLEAKPPLPAREDPLPPGIADLAQWRRDKGR